MAVTLLAGCAPWVAANPRFATDSARNPGAGPVTSATPGGPPPVAAPKNDLVWKDCTAKGFGDAGAAPTPGVQLECADYDADLDPIAGAQGTVTIGVMRARSVQTPPDAGPLVFSTGSDLPSSLQLPVWISRSGVDVLKQHPVVAVDRRGPYPPLRRRAPATIERRPPRTVARLRLQRGALVLADIRRP